MRKITFLLVLLLFSFTAFGVCNGTVLLEGNNPQDPQEFYLKLNPQYASPSGYLILSQTDPHTINLTVNITTMGWFGHTQNFDTWLSIDAQDPEKLKPGSRNSKASAFGAFHSSQYNLTMSGLEDGVHFIKIRVAGNFSSGPVANFDYESKVSFIVDNKSPTFKDISIKNTTYFENDLELVCTNSEPCSWVAYSLDNQVNVTIQAVNADENITNELLQAKANLTGLAEGVHNLTIYARDKVGNIGVSEAIEFSVNTSMPYWVASIVTGVVIVVLGVAYVLLIVRRRRS